MLKYDSEPVRPQSARVSSAFEHPVTVSTIAKLYHSRTDGKQLETCITLHSQMESKSIEFAKPP